MRRAVFAFKSKSGADQPELDLKRDQIEEAYFLKMLRMGIVAEENRWTLQSGSSVVL